MLRADTWLWLVLLAASCGGCLHSNQDHSYQTVFPGVRRDPEFAQQENLRGLELAESGEFAAAERVFREALRGDLSCAAAHNNLGLALMAQGKSLYESALEFTFAAKLDTQAVEPLVNLGRLYERVGWSKASQVEYAKAQTIAPGNAEVLGRLARARVGSGNRIETVDPILRTLARLENDSDWKRWALAQLEKRGDGFPE